MQRDARKTRPRSAMKHTITLPEATQKATLERKTALIRDAFALMGKHYYGVRLPFTAAERQTGCW